MKQLLKATIYRMRKSMGVKIAIGLIYVAAALYYVLAAMVANGKLEAAQAGSVTGLGDSMIIWLFGSLVIGLLVGADFENKTIHGTIKFGRKKIVGNYMLVSAVFVMIMVLPYTVGSVICIISDIGMQGAEGTVISIFMDNVLEYSKEIPVGKLILSYIAYTIVYVGQLSICVPVAIKLKKTVVVTAFGFFFGMITALLATLASKVKILDNVYRLTPYHYGIAQIGINANIGDMFIGIVVSLIFTGIMGIISWYVFKRADIK